MDSKQGFFKNNVMTETEEIEWVKALLNPLASRKRSSFDFSYWWTKGKIYTCNCSKQTMSNLLLNLVTVTFLAIEVSEVNLHKVNVDGSLWTTATKDCCDGHWTQVCLPNKPFCLLKSCMYFYLHALLLTGVRLWQILAKKLFQSLLRSLLNHIFHLCANDVLVKPLSLICITSVFLNTNSLNVGMLMEDVALINGRSK